MSKRQNFNPGPRAERYHNDLHFSTATRVGDLIWVSGQVGIDPATSAPADGIEAQARFAFDGVKQALESAGSSMDNILELLTYHTDMARDGEIFGRVKDEYIKEPYPCWTGIGVTHLARPELLCEVRVVAYAND
ncbi:RidA family protein [Rhodococcus sp. NM-2]|uniref:RidA family protein n=1 Tax=Rhodococcus TaxID=1827 RepID=UPI0035185F8A